MTLPQDIADKLTPLDQSLLLGREDGWGSWMWDSANHMVSLGLGTKRDGSISFDTPLADEVRSILTKEPSQ